MALPSAWLLGAERQSMEQNQEEARSETLHAVLQTENEPWFTEIGKGMLYWHLSLNWDKNTYYKYNMLIKNTNTQIKSISKHSIASYRKNTS